MCLDIREILICLFHPLLFIYIEYVFIFTMVTCRLAQGSLVRDIIWGCFGMLKSPRYIRPFDDHIH